MIPSLTAEQQFLAALKDIYENGHDIPNARTGKVCRMSIDVDFHFDASTDRIPLLTTRKMYLRPIVAELMGYFRQFTSAAQFRAIGAKTWDANANVTKAWLANPNRKGEDDLGIVYGAVAGAWPKADGTTINLFEKVYNNLKRSIDDRAEIITYFNPGLFDLGCLRPCMFQHHFKLIDGVLHLRSYSRSMDLALGGSWNIVQAWLFLKLMAIATGHRAGTVRINCADTHVYSDQLALVPEQLAREPFAEPTIDLSWLEPIAARCTSWDEFVHAFEPSDFVVKDYQSHPPINYPFSE